MSEKIIAGVRQRFELVKHSLGERARRHWVGAEADAIGRGGVKWVSVATGMAISTVRAGRDELRQLAAAPETAIDGRERRRGGGRKRLKDKDLELVPRLLELVSPTSRGDPESPLQWTTLSLSALSQALTREKHPASPSAIQKLLHEQGFSLQSNSKVKEGSVHPDRDAQFRHISATADGFLSRGLPVISVDAKKKEFLGQRASPGREWAPKGQPVKVMSHDFVSEKDPVAIPYGIYDVGKNVGFVNVGADHNTPTFAVRSIAKWWRRMGKRRYPKAKELFVTADAGGSNSARSHVFKVELQKLSDKTGLTIHVSHFPPGTSKWNKIEHRLFSFITMKWRGRPLTSYELIVSLIANTRTKNGLRVVAELDKSPFPRGIEASAEQIASLSLTRASFRGEWNYVLHPRSAAERRANALKPRVRARVSHAARRERWRTLVRRHKRSGMSAQDFCKKEKIPYSSFVQQRRTHDARPTQKEIRARWAELISEQNRSGLNVAAFCAKRGVRFAAFCKARSRMIQRNKHSAH